MLNLAGIGDDAEQMQRQRKRPRALIRTRLH
jgi:hypothetical protein